ncbi:MAG: glycosyltransferase family 2 protein [Nitrospinota bacterium]|nr:glycosyltransferase family 2 protein [Nitrospinota bacterium]
MNTEPPLITTIIPTYRRPELLKRSIESVLRQTYPHLQVCVYDNASGDETAQVVADLAKKDPRVKYHCHAENIGAFNNFIYGMERVNTPFFSFLSDDDLLLPNFYEIATDGFNKYPDAMFSAASTIAMTKTGNILDVSLLSWSREGYFSPPEGMFEMAHGCPAWTSILFRRETIDEVGPLDIDIIGPADYDFQLRTAIRFPIVVVKKPCAIFLNHESSFSANTSLDHFWPGWKKLNEKIYDDQRIPLEVRKQATDLLSKYFRRALISMAIKLMIKRNRGDLMRISEIFRQYLNLPGKAVTLKVMAQIFRIPGTGRMIAWADRLRRTLGTARKKSQLNREYGDYVKWL